MINVTAQIVGSQLVQARLQEAGPQFQQRVKMTVHSLGLTLLAKVKEQYLTGQALNTRSGRLRRSINEKFTQEGSTFSSSVGTNLPYGRFWELGFTGLEEVRAYTRQCKSLDAYKSVLKRRIYNDRFRDEVVSWRNGREKVSSGMTTVRAHSRNVNQAARPFLQPALAAMKDQIRAELTSAIAGRA